MTSKKTARRALFSSVMAMILCVAMLVSTTFAWFTDVAETGMNQIIAGNLDIELLDAAGNNIEGSTELFKQPELWEPGAVAYAQMQVKNVGNLDLKYSLSVNYEDVNSLDGHALSEVLKYAIIDATNVDLQSREAVLEAAKKAPKKVALNDYAFEDKYLEPAATSDLQTLVVFWEPNADDTDNLYNVNNGKETSDGEPLQIDLGIRVYATQKGGEDSNEKDSFGPDYDLNAPTQVLVNGDATGEVFTSLADAVAEHGASNTFIVSGPIDLNVDLVGATVTFKQMPDSSPAIIDCTKSYGLGIVENADITFDGVVIQGVDKDYIGLQHTKAVTYKNCVIDKSLTLYADTVLFDNCKFYLENRYIWTYGADEVTFSGCTFNNANSKAILVYQETDTELCTVYVKNCTFNASAKGYTGAGDWTAAVEIDASMAPAKVEITNSTADSNYNGIVRVKAGASNATVTVNNAPLLTVTTADELQDALNNAADGTVIALGKDITGDVTAPQKANVKLTIEGNGKNYDGTITVDGKSARYDTAGITIKNVNFKSADISKDAYINLGVKGDSNTRYTNHVTVSNCTFDTTSSKDVVAIKSYTGGDKNLTVNGCTVNAGMHSALQVTNVEEGLEITNCKVYSKNGINLNNTPAFEMSGCEFDTAGYAVRVGVNGTVNTAEKNFTISNSTLKSANDDGDAVIILRDNAKYATLTLTNTTLVGDPKYSVDSVKTTIVEN